MFIVFFFYLRVVVVKWMFFFEFFLLVNFVFIFNIFVFFSVFIKVFLYVFISIGREVCVLYGGFGKVRVVLMVIFVLRFKVYF